MKYQLLTIFLLFGLTLGTAGAQASAANISGTWENSVDYGSGSRSNGTIVFEQKGEKLSGTYSSPSGEYKFIGTVKENKVVFSFDVPIDGQPYKVIFNATIESPTKMTGTFELPKGPAKWTATKK